MPIIRQEFSSPALARPLFEWSHDWFELSMTKLSCKSDTTAAIRYALTLWPALTRYHDDHLEIDNNAKWPGRIRLELAGLLERLDTVTMARNVYSLVAILVISGH